MTIQIISKEDFTTMRICGMLNDSMDPLSFSITAAILMDKSIPGIIHKFDVLSRSGVGYLMRDNDTITLYQTWASDMACREMLEIAKILGLPACVIRIRQAYGDIHSFKTSYPDTFPDEDGGVTLSRKNNRYFNTPLTDSQKEEIHNFFMANGD